MIFPERYNQYTKSTRARLCGSIFLFSASRAGLERSGFVLFCKRSGSRQLVSFFGGFFDFFQKVLDKPFFL